MKSMEKLIKHNSNYYIHTPSSVAKTVFLYPTMLGYYYYEKGYHIARDNFSSYLIMIVKKGELLITTSSKEEKVISNRLVILDCYKKHSYTATKDSEVIWIHFTGQNAKNYFEYITNNENEIVFNIEHDYQVENGLKMLYEAFENKNNTSEATLSKLIVDILTNIILVKESEDDKNHNSVIEKSVKYINANFTKELSLEKLAKNENISNFYYLHSFKSEMNITPHQYIIKLRINYAKHLLKSTSHTVNEICFLSGFTNVSTFCTTFKAKVGLTPSAYR